jgi:hypothetical protein
MKIAQANALAEAEAAAREYELSLGQIESQSLEHATSHAHEAYRASCLRADLRTIQYFQEQLQCDLVSLEKANSELAGRYAALNEQQVALDAKHAALDAEHAVLDAKHASLYAQHSILDSEHAALIEQHTALTEKYSMLAAENVQLKAFHDSWKNWMFYRIVREMRRPFRRTARWWKERESRLDAVSSKSSERKAA